MENTIQMSNPRKQTKNLDWLYLQEDQEDDFLMGRIPSEFRDIGEEDEE